MKQDELKIALTELLRSQSFVSPGEVTQLTRLSGGANMETWSFDWRPTDQISNSDTADARPMILRRRPGDSSLSDVGDALSLTVEWQLMDLARRARVPAPTLIARADAGTTLGEALVMTRVLGDALPQRLLRDEGFLQNADRIAFQCGEALGGIHSVAIEDCPAGLRDLSWERDMERLQALCDRFGNPSPAHQLALNWLRRQPAPESARVLCHGDFRLGNLLFADGHLSAVLDWELAHLGYAGEDLGYLCANVWRFGGTQPVGGFGSYQHLLDGYRSVRGVAPAMSELLLWQLYAALGWGLVCLTMLELHCSGADPGLERAAVGRRLSESEVDILLLLEELDR